MSDQWNFYPLLVDDEPASIFVDLGIANAAPMSDFPIMGYLRVKMRNPREDGLSSQEEYDTLIEIENDIEKFVKTDKRYIFVGRNTSSGNRDFYFYAYNESIENALKVVMKNWSDYEFQTGCRNDPEWSTYWKFLYPSPEALQRMGNRDVISSLLEHGDKIDISRKIDHFAVFKTRHDRDEFSRYIISKGYNVIQINDTPDEDFQIEFDRLDRPDQIDEVTIDLYRAALKQGGEYDGWGCPTAS